MDLLSVSGLINYFGKWTNLSKVEVTPLLFKKGSTHLALYGLSYIKDQRLSRLLRDKKVYKKICGIISAIFFFSHTRIH